MLHHVTPNTSCTDIYIYTHTHTHTYTQGFCGRGVCRTFSGKRIEGKSEDSLADIGVGAIRRECLQERTYKVSENLFTGTK
jgi:hypothetical protein